MPSKPVENLSPVPAERRAEFAALPPLREAHAGAMASVAAFGEIESAAAPAGVEKSLLRVAAWNLERCLYPDAAARLLRQQGVDLVLLSEMDSGMLRTGQRHTTRDLAGVTTRRSTWSSGLNPRQLDWFCTRGLVAEAPAVMPSVDEVGKVLSDHDAILLTLRL